MTKKGPMSGPPNSEDSIGEWKRRGGQHHEGHSTQTWVFGTPSSDPLPVPSGVAALWASETGAANRVAAINPPIDDTDPMRKFSIDRKLHGLAKPSKILSEREAHTEFQYRPHIVDTDTIADAVVADAVSETSMLCV